MKFLKYQQDFIDRARKIEPVTLDELSTKAHELASESDSSAARTILPGSRGTPASGRLLLVCFLRRLSTHLQRLAQRVDAVAARIERRRASSATIHKAGSGSPLALPFQPTPEQMADIAARWKRSEARSARLSGFQSPAEMYAFLESIPPEQTPTTLYQFVEPKARS
jgi:hypothetical protein